MQSGQVRGGQGSAVQEIATYLFFVLTSMGCPVMASLSGLQVNVSLVGFVHVSIATIKCHTHPRVDLAHSLTRINQSMTPSYQAATLICSLLTIHIPTHSFKHSGTKWCQEITQTQRTTWNRGTQLILWSMKALSGLHQKRGKRQVNQRLLVYV